MQRCRNNKTPRNGIPHHGVLILMGAQFLLATGLWGAQCIVSLTIGQQTSAIIFGVANIVTCFLLIGAVWLFTRLERGYLVTLDKSLA